MIRYDVRIDSFAATLTTVSRNGGITWKCNVSMGASAETLQLARDMAEMASRGMNVIIRDLKGRQIFPVSSGWLPIAPASHAEP